MIDPFEAGLAAHRAGDLAGAEKHYRALLRAEPAHIDAHNLLGMLCHQTGRSAEAEMMFRRCLQLAPDFAAARVSLGNALLAQGKYDAAAASFRAALQQDPGLPSAHHGLGNTLWRQGHSEAAAAAFRAAIGVDPGFFESALSLGDMYVELDRPAEALAAYRAAESIDASSAEALSGEVEALMRLGRAQEAFAVQRRLVERHPDSFAARLSLAWLHLKATDRDAGRAALLAAAPLSRLPGDEFELAQAWMAADDLDAAERCAERARAGMENPAPALLCLGKLAETRGDVDRAEMLYRQALAADPGAGQARLNLALVDLLQGRYPESWQAYEVRHEVVIGAHPPVRPHDFPFPMWRGEPLAGKRILVAREQGLGDQLLCLRFVSDLAAAAGVVDLWVDPPLARIAASLPKVGRVYSARSEIDAAMAAGSPRYDYWVFVMSLPARRALRLEDLPGKVPCLAADAPAQARWREFFAVRPRIGPRIGLVWAGNRALSADSNRSLSCALIADWFRVPGIEWYSLVKGEREAELAALPDAARVVRLGDRLDDFCDTAAVMGELDLVISVDSAAAHLAGNLGRPAWVLVPRDTDWRWLREREDSPWYPSLRLFRQRRYGAWQETIDRVTAELSRFTAGSAPIVR